MFAWLYVMESGACERVSQIAMITMGKSPRRAYLVPFARPGPMKYRRVRRLTTDHVLHVAQIHRALRLASLIASIPAREIAA